MTRHVTNRAAFAVLAVALLIAAADGRVPAAIGYGIIAVVTAVQQIERAEPRPALYVGGMHLYGYPNPERQTRQ